LVNTLGGRLNRLGVKMNKHIPEIYFRAPVADRLSLLQGLMDTDGSIADARGLSWCEFSVCSERLARGFYRLVTELGIKASWRQGDAKLYGRVVGTRYRIGFQSTLPVFRLERKACKQTDHLTSVSDRRAIVAVEPMPSVPVRCIQVENRDGMFLAGEGCIPTHNSVLVRQMAFCMAAGIHPFDPRVSMDPVRVLVFDAENDDDELEMAMQQVRDCVERRAGKDAPAPGLFSVPYGVDLASRRDRGDFLAVLEDFRPQIIVGGPVYKMTDQTLDLSEDRRAAIVQSIFNDVRKRWGSAILLEHHAPTGQSGKSRELKAKGGQVWPAWVNMTVALHAINDGQSVEVKYPHPPRGKFRWPKQFDRGTMEGDWPWIPVIRSSYATPVAQPTLELVAPEEDESQSELDWSAEPF
jgi:hypothetical protein